MFYFQYQCHANSIHNHHNIWFQVIAAEGEQKASRALREAAETIADSHSALQVHAILHTFYDMSINIYQTNPHAYIYTNIKIFQLRYLQTLNSISAEKNSTIIFPFPMELLSQWALGKEVSPSRPPSSSTSIVKRLERADTIDE